jgi:hypothetical protein
MANRQEGQKTYRYRLEPKSLASLKAAAQARKAQGQRQFGAGCLAASSTKTRMTKVQTGITEDYWL